MFNEIIMLLASLVFLGVIAYLAWDSYQGFKKHDSK